MPADPSIYGLQQAPRINTPFENLAQVLAVRNQQENQRALAEQRRALAQQTDERTKMLQQQQADVAAIDAAGTDLSKLPQHLRPVVEKQLREADEWNEKVKKAKTDAEQAELGYAAHLANGVLYWEKYGPEAMLNAAQTALQVAKAHGHDVSQIETALQNDPTQLKPMLESIIARHQGSQAPVKPPQTVSPGQGVLNQATGKYDVPIPATTNAGKPSSVQEYEYAVQHDGFKGTFEDYQNADANRKQKAAAERAPYFTYQTTFDATGRPTGAIRFDARGGPPVNVPISEITGGSQLKPPPGTTGAQAISNEVSTAQLDRLKGMFDRGGKAFIGPAEGRLRSIGQNVPGVPVNKTFADFDAASSAFKNAVIKAITGAQMSEREADRIIGQIPTVNDKPEVWLAKAEQTRKNLQDLNAALQKKSGTAASSGGESIEHRVWRVGGKIGPEPK